MRAPKYHDLQGMSDQELIKLYDKTAEDVVVGLQWLRDELHQRALERDAATTRGISKWALVVSIISAVAAVSAVVVAIIAWA